MNTKMLPKEKPKINPHIYSQFNFNKGAKINLMGQESFQQKLKTGYPCAK